MKQEFENSYGQTYTAKFTWRVIGECRKILKSPALAAVKLVEIADRLKKDKEAKATPEERETVMETNLDTLDSMFHICKAGLKAGHPELTDDEAEEILDNDPSLIRKIFHFFKKRNELYQANLDHDPEEELRETGEKKA